MLAIKKTQRRGQEVLVYLSAEALTSLKINQGNVDFMEILNLLDMYTTVTRPEVVIM